MTDLDKWKEFLKSFNITYHQGQSTNRIYLILDGDSDSYSCCIDFDLSGKYLSNKGMP